MKTNARVLTCAIMEVMQDLRDLGRAEKFGRVKSAALYERFVSEDLAELKRLAGAENIEEVLKELGLF